jgi:hypothetical protein
MSGTIPSGVTVTGVIGGLETSGGSSNVQVFADFNGLRAPANLSDADVNFDDVGLSAAAAASAEEDAGCTGGISDPTAPAGKVCIYLFQDGVDDGTGHAFALGNGTPFTEADRYGFFVSAFRSGAASLRGTWAYHAP